MIAEPDGTSFKAGLIEFQAYKLQDFVSSIDFVDQLDIDGDGVAEVFAKQQGFDAYVLVRVMPVDRTVLSVQ